MSDTKNLTAKLVEVMAAIDHVDKRGRNDKQNYSYVKATDLARATREELVKVGVLMIASVVNEERWQQPTQSGGTMNYCNLTVEFCFRDTESDATISFFGKGWGQDTGDKSPYKALTGALKYALRTSFLIPDESDPENESAEKNTRNSRATSRDTGAADSSKSSLKPAAPKHPQDTPGPQSDAVCITTPMAKRFFAIAKQNNWTDFQIKELLLGYGYEHSKEIRNQDYNQLVGMVSVPAKTLITEEETKVSA